LAVALFTTSIAAAIIYFYRITVEQIVILAAIMPVIAALGGNAGTQALAVTVRRLALSPERSGAWKVVGKEAAVGLINGLVIGLLAAVIGYLLPEGSVLLGLVVMLAMWGNLVIAGFYRPGGGLVGLLHRPHRHLRLLLLVGAGQLDPAAKTRRLNWGGLLALALCSRR
jgi:magnesium transporter